LINEELKEKIGEFEEILQRIANDTTNGILSEKLPPSELLKKTENHAERLTVLATSGEELMLILKPEKAYTVKSKCKNLTQSLTTFKDILVQNTSDPLANSRLAFEQLRKVLADGSDLLSLMKEVRDNPSPLINSILTFKKASETKSSIISIQAKEDIQPLIKYILSRMDDFRTALINLEKRVDEMKQIMRELQEESLKILSGETSKQNKPNENKTEKKQLSLSNFKGEQN
jgi:thiamine monophosphate kinase